jgi:excinuclease UvrABC nuclease subunit
MNLYQLHPFTREEIQNMPARPGVFVLFQVENHIYVGGGANLRKLLQSALPKYPQATHFAVETARTSASAIRDRVRSLREQLSRVRKAGFVATLR